MFTGIVEAVGSVRAVEPRDASVRLVIEAPDIVAGLALGASVAVNGACLTVAALAPPAIAFDVVRETLDRTALGGLAPGHRVNLERALRAEARLDGHIVQGHVDGTGRVAALERRGDDVRLEIACPEEFTDWLVEKGSVAIDGVSLTVVAVGRDRFEVALVPHTLAKTTLAERAPGDRVNLEADVLGKYVRRHLGRMLGDAPGSGTA